MPPEQQRQILRFADMYLVRHRRGRAVPPAAAAPKRKADPAAEEVAGSAAKQMKKANDREDKEEPQCIICFSDDAPNGYYCQTTKKEGQKYHVSSRLCNDCHKEQGKKKKLKKCFTCRGNIVGWFKIFG